MSYEIFINTIKDNIFWIIVLGAILLIVIQKKIKAKRLVNKESKFEEEEEGKPNHTKGPFGIEEKESSMPEEHKSLEHKYTNMINNYKQQLKTDIEKLSAELNQLDNEAERFNLDYKKNIELMNKKYADTKSKKDKLIKMIQGLNLS